MKKNIVYLMLASLLLFTGCANYLDQDPEDLNSMDKIFSSKIETTKWYNRIYSDDFMVQEMHYSGQIPYFWCTDESAYILESHVRNIAEGKMSPDNYYGYTGYNLYFFVRYYQAIRHCNLLPLPAAAPLRPDPHRRDQPFGRPDRGFAGAQHARRMRPLDQRRDRLGL